MSRRLNLELTDMAEQELVRLMDLTGLPIDQLLKHAVTILRIYVDSREDGKELVLNDLTQHAAMRNERC